MPRQAKERAGARFGCSWTYITRYFYSAAKVGTPNYVIFGEPFACFALATTD